MRALLMFAIASASAGASSPDAREIVRKSIELDQTNWVRMKDYTWILRETTRHLDSSGGVKSTESQAWETMILFGKPELKQVERNGQALAPDQQRKEQEKIDKLTEKLENGTPAERQRRVDDFIHDRQKDRDFLHEIPDAFDLQVIGEEEKDGHDTWVISATPKPGYQAKHSDAKAFARIEGKIWIDQAGFQWVRIEARTTQPISAGVFFARLNAGAMLTFEQARVNDDVWLPKRLAVSGSGRLLVLKKLSVQQETTWSDYRKFHVDSEIVSTR